MDVKSWGKEGSLDGLASIEDAVQERPVMSYTQFAYLTFFHLNFPLD